MKDREKVKKQIRRKMEEHGISPDELRESGGDEMKNKVVEKMKPRPAPPERQKPQRRSVKNPNANSETKVTSGGFLGRAPILGGHRRGIFDSNKPIISGGRKITGRPVLGNNTRPIVGNRGRPISQGSILGNKRVVGNGEEISKRIIGR